MGTRPSDLASEAIQDSEELRTPEAVESNRSMARRLAKFFIAAAVSLLLIAVLTALFIYRDTFRSLPAPGTIVVVSPRWPWKCYDLERVGPARRQSDAEFLRTHDAIRKQIEEESARFGVDPWELLRIRRREMEDGDYRRISELPSPWTTDNEEAWEVVTGNGWGPDRVLIVQQGLGANSNQYLVRCVRAKLQIMSSP